MFDNSEIAEIYFINICMDGIMKFILFFIKYGVYENEK